MATSIPADQFINFEREFRMALVMPIIIERYGSKIARDLEGAILECQKDSSKRPNLIYPRF